MAEFYDTDEMDVTFKGVGALIKESPDKEESYKRTILGAYRYPGASGSDDNLLVTFTEPPASDFPVDSEETTTDPDTGIITFSVFDGNYTIRKLEENDGTWVSKYKIPLPVDALESIVETERVMNYMAYMSSSEATGQEHLVALSQDAENGPVYAATYENAIGLFNRVNGTWVLLGSNHEDFDGLYGTFIDPDRAEEFLSAFDKGGMTVPEADTYQEPEDGAVTAAGGLDRNRGNAEKLRRYWVHGEGAAKIRWGTPGDWARCVRHLSKYMGPRAKGYCQLRHKEALGIYTATHAKRDRAKNFNLEAEFTQVTELDMAKTLGQLFFEPDAIFASDWEPEADIAAILELAANDDSFLQEESE
jgi:hypothetical protein